MKYRNPLLALAVLAALSGAAHAANPPSAATPAPAQDDADGHGGGLARLDKNGDGVVDRGEAAASPRLAERFDQLDRNKDGKLTPDELPRHRRHGEHRMHDGGARAKLDANKDGRISRDEAKADPKFTARFDAMDANKDGFVDRTDRQLRAKQHRDAWFAEADTDKDGKLSRAEFDAAHAKRDTARPHRQMGDKPAGALDRS